MALFSSIMGLADLFTSNSTPEQSEVAQREGRVRHLTFLGVADLVDLVYRTL
jgi:hypothetical protein